PLIALPLGAKRVKEAGVSIEVIREAPPGAAVAVRGCEVRLLYKGTLPGKGKDNNRQFDVGETDFLLGDNTMLRGLSLGIIGMAVGERRVIHVPWRLGYGRKGKKPKVPPMSDLDFDCSLLFCGVDWKNRCSNTSMSNARREASKRKTKKTKAT
ncbi:unnamed protein product, partial [Polarella glacialis]